MTRKSIGAVFAAFMVAAIVAALLKQTGREYESADLVVFHKAGAAAALFVTAGLIPIIWWGVRRFRTVNARGPLILWGILQVLLSVTTILGDMVGPPR